MPIRQEIKVALTTEKAHDNNTRNKATLPRATNFLIKMTSH
jgi:hypothetical protein